MQPFSYRSRILNIQLHVLYNKKKKRKRKDQITKKKENDVNNLWDDNIVLLRNSDKNMLRFVFAFAEQSNLSDFSRLHEAYIFLHG